MSHSRSLRRRILSNHPGTSPNRPRNEERRPGQPDLRPSHNRRQPNKQRKQADHHRLRRRRHPRKNRKQHTKPAGHLPHPSQISPPSSIRKPSRHHVGGRLHIQQVRKPNRNNKHRKKYPRNPNSAFPRSDAQE